MKRNPTRWLIVAAVIGECCSKPHAFVYRSRAKRWEDVIDGYYARLKAKGFDVGEIFALDPATGTAL